MGQVQEWASTIPWLVLAEVEAQKYLEQVVRQELVGLEERSVEHQQGLALVQELGFLMVVVEVAD